MEYTQINRKSWHYRLFSVYGPTHGYTTNLCAYMRGVLRGFILALLCVIGGVLGGMVVLEPILTIAGWLQTGWWDPVLGHGDPAILALGTAIIAFFVLGILWFAYEEYVPEMPALARTDEEGNVTTYGLISQWIKGQHDKVCFKIKLN